MSQLVRLGFGVMGVSFSPEAKESLMSLMYAESQRVPLPERCGLVLACRYLFGATYTALLRESATLHFGQRNQ